MMLGASRNVASIRVRAWLPHLREAQYAASIHIDEFEGRRRNRIDAVMIPPSVYDDSYVRVATLERKRRCKRSILRRENFPCPRDFRVFRPSVCVDYRTVRRKLARELHVPSALP